MTRDRKGGVAKDPFAGQVIVHIGTTGAGKTFALTHDVLAAVRRGTPVIVLDRMFEWEDIPAGLADVTRGAEDAFEAIKYIERKGARLVILRPDGDPVQVAETLAKWAIQHDGPAGVAIPEAHNVLPSSKLQPPQWLDKMMTGRRHYQTILWLDTQRPSRLNITAVELATVTRVFATPGKRDREVLAATFDRDFVDKIREVNERYAKRVRAGQKSEGWHIALDISKMPPYDIVRIGGK